MPILSFDPVRRPPLSRRAIPVSLADRFPVALFAVALLAVAPSVAWAQESGVEADSGTVAPPAASCLASDTARQLDFWIGTWDVYNPEGRRAGVNVIERHLGGCMLLENWTGARGSEGKSMNYWDPQRRTWRQVWVSDRGNVLDYRHGEYRDGAMRFRGITIAESGDTTRQRLTFEDVAPDTVRQVFEASTDGGLTWDTTWVGIYVRRSEGGERGSSPPGGRSPLVP